MTVHCTFPFGSKIHIILNDGTSIVDHWVGKKSKYLLLRNYGKLPIKDIRATSFYKNQTND